MNELGILFDTFPKIILSILEIVYKINKLMNGIRIHGSLQLSNYTFLKLSFASLTFIPISKHLRILVHIIGIWCLP